MGLKHSVSGLVGLGCLGLVCLLGAPAVAAPAIPTERPLPHTVEDLTSHAIAQATTLANPMAGEAQGLELTAAADRPAEDLLPISTQRTAGEAAEDSAATAKSSAATSAVKPGMKPGAAKPSPAPAGPMPAIGPGVCNAYFTQSQALSDTVAPALTALGKRDLTTLGTQLPTLQAQLDSVTAAEVRPEICDGNHINAYTSYQYFELSEMRAHGLKTGLPDALPLVKQPDLNQSALAYIVGWTLYEQKDYQGALAVYGKGLTMFPHDHGLLTEYMATLVALGRGAQAIAFADATLNDTYDLDDVTRSRIYLSRAAGLVLLGRLDEADSMLTVSLRYRYTDGAKKLQDQLRQAKAAAK